MNCLCLGYFKVNDEWFQPGVKADIADAEAEKLASKGFVKIIRTAAMMQPETREARRPGRGGRKNENASPGDNAGSRSG